MIQLNYDQYCEAVGAMATALVEAQVAGLSTNAAKAMTMLEALAEKFDIAAVDPGPPDGFGPTLTGDDIGRMLHPSWRGGSALMHRHDGFVSHYGLDHDHGPCTDHAHWAGGTHPDCDDLEVSTPANDPFYYHPNPNPSYNALREWSQGERP